MDTRTSEQALRREAIRRLLQGERPCDICRDLNRGRTWLHKWWSHYQLNPKTDFADRSRSPHTCNFSKSRGRGDGQGVGLGGTVMPWENEFRYRTFPRKHELLW